MTHDTWRRVSVMSDTCRHTKEDVFCSPPPSITMAGGHCRPPPRLPPRQPLDPEGSRKSQRSYQALPLLCTVRDGALVSWNLANPSCKKTMWSGLRPQGSSLPWFKRNEMILAIRAQRILQSQSLEGSGWKDLNKGCTPNPQTKHLACSCVWVKQVLIAASCVSSMQVTFKYRLTQDYWSCWFLLWGLPIAYFP